MRCWGRQRTWKLSERTDMRRSCDIFLYSRQQMHRKHRYSWTRVSRLSDYNIKHNIDNQNRLAGWMGIESRSTQSESDSETATYLHLTGLTEESRQRLKGWAGMCKFIFMLLAFNQIFSITVIFWINKIYYWLLINICY